MKFISKGFFVFLFSILFFSCQNFLGGSELKQKLDKVIEIASSEDLSVEINLRNPRSGSVTPSGVTKVKKWQTFEIELSVKSGFSFDGNFSVFEKSAGKVTAIKNPADIVKFEEKATYNTGAGSWTYIYEITVLKELKTGLLINPDIYSINSKVEPTILDMTMDYRYEDRTVVDYFDLHIYAEEESAIDNVIEISFLDRENEVYVMGGEESTVPYYCTVEDMGNGKYHLYTTVDMRDEKSQLYDDMEFKIKVTVKNDGGLTKSKIYDGLFTKQSYSKTQISVFNATETIFSGFKLSPQNFTKDEKSLMEFSRTLNLVVLGIDDKGLGINPDGKLCQISYGITQNKDELDTLETPIIIDDYEIYDSETEFKKIDKLIENAIYSSSYEQGLTISEIITGTGEEVQKIIDENQETAKVNKALYSITLPDNLDVKEDTFIKVTTSNGIRSRKYAVFTIPAAPKVIEAKKEITDGYGSILVSLFSENEDVKKDIFVLDPNDKTQKKWESAHTYIDIPEDYIMNNQVYPFYVSGHTSDTYYNNEYSQFAREYLIYSLDFVKYNTDIKDTGIQKFPEKIDLDIISKGLNSKTHVITMPLDKEIFNQFDGVYIKYGSEIREVFLDENNKISFDISTMNFCDALATVRTDFSFFLFGSKGGHTYETEYFVSSDDERIKDNLPPVFPISWDIDFDTFQFIVSNIILDYTGSYYTVKGEFHDQGEGLLVDSDNNIEITVIYSGINNKYSETLVIKLPADKYLNIPVGHLKNGTYDITTKVRDKVGNDASYTFSVEVIRNKISSDYVIEQTNDYAFKIKNKKGLRSVYAVDFFDSSDNQWKSVLGYDNLSYNYNSTDACSYSKEIDIKENGIVTIHVNENKRKENLNNCYSYTMIRHFPEQRVSMRDYQILRNSIHFYSDKPFFVRIFQNDTNIGNNIEDWENCQLEPYSFPDIDSNFMNLYSSDLPELDSGFIPFIGTEIDPRYIDDDYSERPFVYSIPWDKLNKKYAVAEVIWADNKKDLIPIDMSLKN